MKIISTQYVFDDDREEKDSPSALTIAWISNPGQPISPADFGDDDPFQTGPFQPFYRADERNSEAVIVRYLEMALSLDVTMEGYPRYCDVDPERGREFCFNKSRSDLF